ncbi:MAG: hypothetical protein RIT23_1145 [Actinomycetota bacterium]
MLTIGANHLIFYDGCLFLSSPLPSPGCWAKFSEKDGWIKIAALGFGFSTPTVKVKFAQVKSQTIVCVKGKATKKVTGAKPVCPKGWKKK